MTVDGQKRRRSEVEEVVIDGDSCAKKLDVGDVPRARDNHVRRRIRELMLDGGDSGKNPGRLRVSRNAGPKKTNIIKRLRALEDESDSRE